MKNSARDILLTAAEEMEREPLTPLSARELFTLLTVYVLPSFSKKEFSGHVARSALPERERLLAAAGLLMNQVLVKDMEEAEWEERN